MYTTEQLSKHFVPKKVVLLTILFKSLNETT